ncbi:MAG: hypothetical protein WCT50_03720 [Patescibacteria group bacterium]
MFKKISLFFLTLLLLASLSACSVYKGKTTNTSDNNSVEKASSSESTKESRANFKIISEIVYDEKVDIKDLKDFAQAAQQVAIDKIGSDAKLKRVEFVYQKEKNYLSYNAIYLSDSKFDNGLPKNIWVTYNKKYNLIDDKDLQLSSHESSDINNKQLMGMQCSLDKYCEGAVAFSSADNINVDDLKISLVDLVNKYEYINPDQKYGRNGRIAMSKGVLKGIYSRYRFKPTTGEVALVDDIDEAQWFGYTSISSAIATTAIVNSLDSKKLEVNASDLNVPRIMMWSGKVNQHWDLERGVWLTDLDGQSGAGLDKLTYCKKFYPDTVSAVEYKNETTDTWKSGGNEGNYTSTRTSYRCVLKGENI